MNLKFLSHLGKVIIKGAGVLTSPMASKVLKVGAALTPTTIDDRIVDTITSLRGIVEAVEVVGQSAGLTGAQKLDAASALARQVILRSEAFAGHEIADEAAFETALKQTVSGVVGMLNALKVNEPAAAA